MSVHDLVLFVSSVSKVCGPVVQYIREANFPVRIVRLDTAADRNKAKNGRNFQINIVPTLLVTRDDGSHQLFIGQEKCTGWIQQFIQSTSTETPDHHRRAKKLEYSSSSSSEEEDPVYITPKKAKTKKRVPKKVKPKKKSVPKKPVPEVFSSNESSSEEDYGDLTFEDPNGQTPQTLPTEGLVVGAGARRADTGMNNLMNMAKQMADQRQNALGYKEEDLPKTY